MLDAQACQVLTVVAVGVIGAIYLALRSGWNRRFADPALMALQLWAGMVCRGGVT